MAVGEDELDAVDGVGDGDAADFVILVADHLAEFACGNQLHGVDAETGAEDAVERGRGAAALEVAEDAGARLFFGPVRDFVGDDRADAAEFEFTLGGGGAEAFLAIGFAGALKKAGLTLADVTK